MLRFAAAALLLLPTIASAQTTVEDGSTPPAQSDTMQDDSMAELDPADFGPDVVFDGASVEQIEALLANAARNAATDDRQNGTVVRVATDAAGDAILTLDVSGGTGPMGGTGRTEIMELGECNEGTTWVSHEVNCYNAYPVNGD